MAFTREANQRNNQTRYRDALFNWNKRKIAALELGDVKEATRCKKKVRELIRKCI
jgi:hypothetical protein